MLGKILSLSGKRLGGGLTRPEKESVIPRRGIEEVVQFAEEYCSKHGYSGHSTEGWDCTEGRVIAAPHHPPLFISLILLSNGGGEGQVRGYQHRDRVCRGA